MIIQIGQFLSLLDGATFADNGDGYEQRYGDKVIRTFPNSERFWKYFVIPFTTRIAGYPKSLAASFNIREGISSDLENIGNAHYSMFLNLVFANVHLELKMISSMENIYTHLASACDLAEKTIARFYLLLLKCRGEQPELLHNLGRDEFLELAGKIYDEKYAMWQKIYFEEGKRTCVPIEVPVYLANEYFSKLGRKRWQTYKKYSDSIRRMRNIFVHDVRVGRIIMPDGSLWIPRSKHVGRYKSWSDIRQAARDPRRLADFNEQFLQAAEDIRGIETLLNNLWHRLILDFKREFCSKERAALRQLYNLELAGEANVEEFRPQLASSNPEAIFPPSGVSFSDEDLLKPGAGSADPRAYFAEDDLL